MANRTRILIGSFILLALAPGCSNENIAAMYQEVVRVDDQVLTLAEFNEFFELVRMSYTQGQTGKSRAIHEARLRFLLQLIEEMIILRRAEELHLSISDEELERAIRSIQKGYSEESFHAMLIRQAVSFETWKTRLERQLLAKKVIRKELLGKISVTPEEIKDYYEKHHNELGQGKKIHIRQILLRSEKTAKEVLERINKGERFAALARLYSIAPESERGGDMGYLDPGQLPKSLEKAISKLKPGTLSPVIKTPYGFHIFEVIERKEPAAPVIDDWVEKIRERIRKDKLEAAYGPWLAGLRERYNIKVNRELI